MTTRSNPCALAISEWRAAPFRVDGEAVFAIGDIHGCADQLSVLLETASQLARNTGGKSRLIFLGDLISRGPSSLDALALWSSPSLENAFDKVHRLWGNHEQLLMLSIGGGVLAKSAESIWMQNDGNTFVNELRRRTAKADAPLTRSLVVDAIGEPIMERLQHLEKCVCIGNAIFVHAGIDPTLDVPEALSMSWDTFGGNHWAWIREPFLAWRAGFGGSMIVHGHTPPEKHRLFSGYPDPHVIQHDRLCLDAGSAVTGIVAAAQIEDGR